MINLWAKRPPIEWEGITGMKVLDPDGWRSDGKSWGDPIDYAEWLRRSSTSTVSLIKE